VGILFGRRGANGGLSSAGNQVLTQDSPGIPDDPQADDDFGGALAGGDFNGDDVTDLAIGLRFRDVPATGTQGGGTLVDAGAVVVLFGQFGVGLTGAGSRFFDENDLNVASLQGADGFAQAGARFGRALAAGDFDGDGSDDLAVGSHLKRVGGRGQAGALWVLNGPLSPGAQTLQFWHQARVFPGADSLSERDGDGTPNEPGDQFGTTLAAGDFNADGFRDLAIGVPFEDVLVQRSASSFEFVLDAGAVVVIYGSADGLSITGRRPQFWTQQSINVEDDAESGDRFGASLTAWNFGRNGPDTRRVCRPINPPNFCFDVPIERADLAIGVSRENVGNVPDAGAVNVLYGSLSGNGLTFLDDQLWTQGTPGVPGDGPDADDTFGAALY
jgi:FG-GAP repeat